MISTTLDEVATKPMKDYNTNSSYQAKANEAGNSLIREAATYLLCDPLSELYIVDFGCSHGKNSMECVRAFLDGCLGIKNRVHITVYLNDLPTNEFSEVFNCLNNPSISFYQHELFNENRDASISCMVNGKSFYSQVFSKNQLNLAFSFFCLQWLEKPIKLSRSIFPGSGFSTKEEMEIISQGAHKELVDFLKYRSYEIKEKGRLIFNILNETGHRSKYDHVWSKYVNSKGFELNQFEPVAVPVYLRSEEEIANALNEVKDDFKVIYNEPYCMADDHFAPDKMRAVLFNSIMKGVVASGVFDSRDNEVSFVNGFFDIFTGPEARDESKFQLIVLERR